MNQTGNSQWHQEQQQQQQQQQQQYDVMNADISQEELTNFLDMDFGFSDFDNAMPLQNLALPDAAAQQPQHNHMQHGMNQLRTDAPDFSNLELDAAFTQMQSGPGHMADFQQQQQQQQMMGTPNPMDFGGHSQFQQVPNDYQVMQLPDYQQHFSVPPTPNSTDVFPGSAHFAPQQGQQSIYSNGNHYQNGKNDAMGVLTPFLSPQVSGHQYPVDVMTDYAMTGFSLSPLTSPAMFPQNPNTHHVQYTHPHTAESSLNGSPIDLGIVMNGDQPIEERPRKTRKKILTPKTSVSGMRPRQALAAHRRKGSLAGVVDAVTADAFRPIQAQPALPPHMKSISPKPLSDTSMAPPPRQNTSDGFPAGLPESLVMLDESSGLPPATPASIMRKRPQSLAASTTTTPYMSPALQQQFAHELQTPVIATLGSGMADLRLPDALQEQASQVPTPRLSTQESRPTPRMLPKIASAAATPIPGATPIMPFQSPLVTGMKGESKTARNSRKRNSTNSTLVSPALRPKISPSIKPLLPGSSETHALLLATKSNYQNIIEGNITPGVNYPAEMATNLTSKRTSHKIAEQGRRNRINTALQELAALIPTSFSTGKDGSNSSGDGEGSPGAVKDETQTNGGKTPATPTTQGSSKAATVEQATAYIKVLQEERKKMEEEMAALKAKCGCAETD